VSRIAWAQTYPTRPVRILVGFAAGGAADTIARLAAQWLSQRLGQQFIVENRTGAGTNIAADSVVHATPDGYTLLFVTSSNAINASMYEHLSFNFLRDIVPVAGLTRVANVMEVNPSVPAKTVPEFHRLCQSQPRKDQHGFRRHRKHAACGWRAVQHDGRRQTRSRAVSRRCSGAG
jgi:tripartite-type tricarboxylate transporter receptor subunit TctC